MATLKNIRARAKNSFIAIGIFPSITNRKQTTGHPDYFSFYFCYRHQKMNLAFKQKR